MFLVKMACLFPSMSSTKVGSHSSERMIRGVFLLIIPPFFVVQQPSLQQVESLVESPTK